MLDRFLFPLTFVAALGCGLIAGVFFAFSAFVMKALGRIPPAQGIAAMRSINVSVIHPWFMLPFFGTAAACLLLIVRSLSAWRAPGAGYQLAGGLLYIVGTIFVTIAFNVPRNNALASADLASPEIVRLWNAYLTGWTFWNHVRTAAALAAAASLITALCLQRT